MQRILRVLIGPVVLSLLCVTVVLAAGQTGVSGRLWDSSSPAQPWEHGARVVAVECTSAGAIGAKRYGCDNASTSSGTYGRFNFAWNDGTSCTGVSVNDPDGPDSGDTGWVCLYIIWNDGGSGQPPDMLTAPQQWMDFADVRMNFGNVQSTTGPTAITLANVTAGSANLWLPVGLAALSVVAVGALIISRRRRS